MDIEEMLKDPAVVHQNMLLGKIAKIDMLTCAHTHGAEMVARWQAFEAFEKRPKPDLRVWYGSMPESNGKSNWTAMLYREGDMWGGITIDRSEYPDRVRYEADRMRFLIGEIDKAPDLTKYDADKCDTPVIAVKIDPQDLVCDISPRALPYPLRDFHRAMTEGPLHYTWQDKPHRLVYDLIAAVKYYAQKGQ